MNELLDAIIAAPNEAKRCAVYGDWRERQERLTRAGDYHHDDWN